MLQAKNEAPKCEMREKKIKIKFNLNEMMDENSINKSRSKVFFLYFSERVQKERKEFPEFH
jgi:hypothetical protein